MMDKLINRLKEALDNANVDVVKAKKSEMFYPREYYEGIVCGIESALEMAIETIASLQERLERGVLAHVYIVRIEDERTILAVFSTREKAERYILGFYREVTIQEVQVQ